MTIRDGSAGWQKMNDFNAQERTMSADDKTPKAVIRGEQTTFNFEDKALRAYRDGENLWFVANDVCDILGLENSRQFIERLDPDEKGVSKIYTPGGIQEMNAISESGLYLAAMRSHKPVARKFTRWVTKKVLPEIRRTGSYSGSSRNDQRSLPRAEHEVVWRMGVGSRIAEKDMALLKHEISGLQLEYGQLANLLEGAIESDLNWKDLPKDCDPYGHISGQVYARFARIIEATNRANALYNEVLKPEKSTDEAYLLVRRGIARNRDRGSETDPEPSPDDDA